MQDCVCMEYLESDDIWRVYIIPDKDEAILCKTRAEVQNTTARLFLFKLGIVQPCDKELAIMLEQIEVLLPEFSTTSLENSYNQLYTKLE